MKRAFFSTMSLPIIVAMVFAFALTFTFFGSAETAEAALSTAGKLTSVEGKVAVFRKGKTKGVRAKVGTLVFPGDKIKTYADSNAQLTLRDNSKIIISPKSTMKMGKFVLNNKTEKRSAFLNILGGKIRIIAQKMYKLTASGKRKLWRNASFKVKTPTAVVGVKGTDFVITVTMKDGTTYTGVIVLEGAVKAQAVSKLGKLSPAVLIGMMESVEVSQEGVSPKKTLTKAEVADVIQDIETQTALKEDMLETVEDIAEDFDLAEDITEEMLDAVEESFEDTTMESITVEESTDTTTSGGTTTCVSPPCL